MPLYGAIILMYSSPRGQLAMTWTLSLMQLCVRMEKKLEKLGAAAESRELEKRVWLRVEGAYGLACWGSMKSNQSPISPLNSKFFV